MDRGAAIGRRQRHVDRIERLQVQHVPRIDRVGIAQQIFDLGDGELRGACGARRLWLGLSDWLPRVGMIERIGHVQVAPAFCLRALPALIAGDRLQTMQEARGDRRRSRDLGRMREDDIARAKQLDEVVGGKADAPFRQIEAEGPAHRPAQPGIVARLRRPHAFDEAADDDAIGFGETRFQRTIDAQCRGQQLARAHDLVAERDLEQLGIIDQRGEEAGRLLARNQGFERVGQRLAILAFEDHARSGGLFAQGGNNLAVEAHCLVEIERRSPINLFERRHRHAKRADKRVDVVERARPDVCTRLGAVQGRRFAGDQPCQLGAEARKCHGKALAARGGPGAAQQCELEGCDRTTPAVRRSSEPKQRMFQQRKQRRWRELFGDHCCRHPREQSGWQGEQGVAAQIFRREIPAAERHLHPPRQRTIRRHQRRAHVLLARFAHRRRNRERFHFRPGRFEHADAVHRGLDVIDHGGLRQPLAPGRGRSRRPHRFGGQHLAAMSCFNMRGASSPSPRVSGERVGVRGRCPRILCML